MPALQTMSFVRTRGITLLEVLLAIGILSIGLLSMLALLPAGRTYLVKAEVDDRAAAIVPSALATIESWGLFRENALEWETRSLSGVLDADPQPAWRPAWDQPDWDRWQKQPPTSARIDSWHDAVPPPSTLRITGRAGEEKHHVTLEVRLNGKLLPSLPVPTEADGTWEKWVPIAPPQDEEIHTTGPNLGEVMNEKENVLEYEFSAQYTKETLAGPVQVDCEQVEPRSAKFEGRKRKQVSKLGRATINLTVENKDGSNDTPDSPQRIELPQQPLGHEVRNHKIRMIRKATAQISGSLWRFHEGTRQGDYTEIHSHGLGASPQPTTLYPPWELETDDPGDDPPLPPPPPVEDRDFFAVSVRKGYHVGLDWGGSPDVTPWRMGRLPLALFNGDTLDPYETAALHERYAIPNNGQFVFGVELTGPVNSVSRPAGNPVNPQYGIDVTIFRGDRMIAIDPLMCTYLDRALAGDLSGKPTLAERRRYFADYERLYGGAATDDHAVVVPRLNWRILADIPDPDFNAPIALAERLCRAEDSPATKEPASADDPLEPLYDRDGAGNPIRRQNAGRMTWMLTVQPEGRGPVEPNWVAGKFFEAAIVVFQDRIFPRPGDNDIEGEYAFRSGWREDEGRLHVEVPTTDSFGRPAPADEDLRRLFAGGGWLLLGPGTSVTTEDISSHKAFEWARIVSAEFERIDPGATPGGVTTLLANAENGFAGTVVKVLLDREPGSNVLLPGVSRPEVRGGLSLATFAYQGVVAVVKRSIQVKP